MDAPDDRPEQAVAAQLGMTLPPECVDGVRANATLLAETWALLRGFVPPDEAE